MKNSNAGCHSIFLLLAFCGFDNKRFEKFSLNIETTFFECIN
jgi:hypothetical protein